MGVLQGIVPQADLTTGSPTDKQKVARVRALIPNPDAPHGNGAKQGSIGGNLDEMSPIAAAQLIAELAALEASVT